MCHGAQLWHFAGRPGLQPGRPFCLRCNIQSRSMTSSVRSPGQQDQAQRPQAGAPVFAVHGGHSGGAVLGLHQGRKHIAGALVVNHDGVSLHSHTSVHIASSQVPSMSTAAGAICGFSSAATQAATYQIRAPSPIQGSTLKIASIIYFLHAPICVYLVPGVFFDAFSVHRDLHDVFDFSSFVLFDKHQHRAFPPSCFWTLRTDKPDTVCTNAYAPSGRGRAAITSRGRAAFTSRGRAAIASRGRAAITSRGRAAFTSRGRAVFTSRGRAAITSRGRAAIASRGRAVFASRGRAAIASRGRAVFTSRGRFLWRRILFICAMLPHKCNLRIYQVTQAEFCPNPQFFGAVFYAVIGFCLVQCLHLGKFLCLCGGIKPQHINGLLAKVHSRLANLCLRLFKYSVLRVLLAEASHAFAKCLVTFHSSVPSPSNLLFPPITFPFSSSKSQTNLPLPLLRHCPSPRSLP
uniref:Uncharacterized protein n=1 Tax=Ackermannviridae sp. TaxID=2831612 RepID=A0A8S5VL46_9CAUD|nr:MAG TPA: hypothetical protein [Ackermannviridae sp.]